MRFNPTDDSNNLSKDLNLGTSILQTNTFNDVDSNTKISFKSDTFEYMRYENSNVDATFRGLKILDNLYTLHIYPDSIRLPYNNKISFIDTDGATDGDYYNDNSINSTIADSIQRLNHVIMGKWNIDFLRRYSNRHQKQLFYSLRSQKKTKATNTQKPKKKNFSFFGFSQFFNHHFIQKTKKSLSFFSCLKVKTKNKKTRENQKKKHEPQTKHSLKSFVFLVFWFSQVFFDFVNWVFPKSWVES